MDTSAAKKPVGDKIQMIKDKMPSTYKQIQAKAAVVGNVAYEWVRRGLRDEPDCFYAFERGYVVGTPFSIPGIQTDVAAKMVQFGVDSCCIWPVEAANGAH